MLDWIAQVSHKTWATADDVGQFVRALNDLLDLQAHVCGMGRSRQIDVGAVLARRKRGSSRT